MLSWAMLAIENESDREFIERLYTQNYAAMLQKAKDILKNHQRAEDAVEAVMLRLIDRIDLLHHCNHFLLLLMLYSCVSPFSILFAAMFSLIAACTKKAPRLPRCF